MRGPPTRTARLLVEVQAISGRSYPRGTVVRLVGTGSGVDGWVGSEWIPLRWWEFTELADDEAAAPERRASA